MSASSKAPRFREVAHIYHYDAYLPTSQWPYDHYPPFASGCGFVLSFDLVLALTSRELPRYRLLDPPFGIHLCGPPGIRVLLEPVSPVHDERIRPYKPLPTFRYALPHF